MVARVRRILVRLARNPLLLRARQIAETLVTPRVRADLASQHARLLHIENQHGAAALRLEEIERHLPRLLNAISSSDGAARMLRRELDDLRTRIDSEFDERLNATRRELSALDDATRGHADTQRWLLARLETIRAEIMYEMRFGEATAPGVERPAAQIIEPAALDPADGRIRLNLGCGHKPLEGYANVDLRPLPGVDVVAAVDGLPVEPGSVAEIYSAHMLEHFPEEQLRRTLLPYWVGLLRPGGVFRAVVPDFEAMTKAYAAGEIEFATLRLVTYGGQEYEGDTHFTGFTVDHLSEMLLDAGLSEIEVVASGRPDGDCLEFELTATSAG